MITRPACQTFTELFTPKLIMILREGRLVPVPVRHDRQADVAIVALSTAIAIASGVTPDRGSIRQCRRLHRLGPGLQPLPDRRSGRRVYHFGRGERADARADGLLLATMLSELMLLAVG